MAEKKQNAQPEKNLDQVEKEKLESCKTGMRSKIHE